MKKPQSLAQLVHDAERELDKALALIETAASSCGYGTPGFRAFRRARELVLDARSELRDALAQHGAEPTPPEVQCGTCGGQGFISEYGCCPGCNGTGRDTLPGPTTEKPTCQGCLLKRSTIDESGFCITCRAFRETVFEGRK